MLFVEKIIKNFLDILRIPWYTFSYLTHEGGTPHMTKPVSDPLLDELNGALAKTQEPVQIDKPGDQAPTLAQQLEVGPAKVAATPRSALADKTHAKAAGGFGYRVWVKGEYYAASKETNGHVVKPYRLAFNLPALTNAKGESALGIIVSQSKLENSRLLLALKRMDPLAKAFRTHVVDTVETLNGAPEPVNIQYMTFDALKAYVVERLPKFPLPVDEYWDANHLREDVIDFKTNETGDVTDVVTGATVKGGFGVKKTAAERIIARHAERRDDKEFSDMNDGL